jgi:hypothetical protein
MGKMTVELSPRGLGSHGWMMLLYYDPAIPTANPAEFSTFKHFDEIDQVMMRSSWQDSEAMMIGFKCGPFMGKTLSPNAIYDYGTGHQGTDSGDVQIFANRQFWAMDPLYPGYKLTDNYNTLRFKGVGQLGEQPGFGSMEALYFKHYPHITHTQSNSQYDYVVGDVTSAYHPALGLKKWLRHLLFVKPDILLIADEIDLDSKGMVYNFPAENMTTSGGLAIGTNDYVVGPQGEASFTFNGVPGCYQLTANYLDNQPGVGRYSMAVEGKKVYRWQSHNEKVDDNLIAISPSVDLRKGSKIAFRGAPMAKECRLIKMTAFSPSVEVPRKVEWLMQFDPHANTVTHESWQEVVLGKARLDLYPLAPEPVPAVWQLHEIKKPVEPFTFRQTRRISLEHPLQGNTTVLLTLIHTRNSDQQPLGTVIGTTVAGKVNAHWISGQQKVSLTWDLQEQSVTLSTQ